MKKSILQTLAYFSLFDYPLTKRELYVFLWKPKEKKDEKCFEETVQSLIQSKQIEMKQGLYFLYGKGKSVLNRKQKEHVLLPKLIIAKKAIKKLRYIPFLKGVFLCNQFFVSTKEDSDIDIFVVAKKNRIWIVRFLAIFFMAIFGYRIKKGKEKNKICLSFFASEDSLNFLDITHDCEDIYLCYWIATLIPIYDPHNIYTRIMKENKIWIKKLLPHIKEEYIFQTDFSVRDSFFSIYIPKFFEIAWKSEYGDMIQKYMSDMQKKKLIRKGTDKTREDLSVIVNDSILKFHENDRRVSIKAKWRKVSGKL
jgi:hypothetical protein